MQLCLGVIIDRIGSRAELLLLMIQHSQESKREKKLKRRGDRTLNDSGVDAAEEELGLQGATADDAEAEHVRQVLLQYMGSAL